MTKSFTTNDLIRYIYQEMEEEENDQLVQILQSDQQLMQEYIDLLSTIGKLDLLLTEPSDSIINAIKKKARSKGLEKV
jgi:tetrahydromethanopterin S-methyltransferase subunit H